MPLQHHSCLHPSSCMVMQAQRQFFASELHAAVLAQHCSRLRQLKHMGGDLSEWNKVQVWASVSVAAPA